MKTKKLLTAFIFLFPGFSSQAFVQVDELKKSI